MLFHGTGRAHSGAMAPEGGGMMDEKRKKDDFFTPTPRRSPQKKETPAEGARTRERATIISDARPVSIEEQYAMNRRRKMQRNRIIMFSIVGLTFLFMVLARLGVIPL